MSDSGKSTIFPLPTAYSYLGGISPRLGTPALEYQTVEKENVIYIYLFDAVDDRQK